MEPGASSVGQPWPPLATASGIAAAVRGGKVSAIEIFDTFADRVRADNPRLNAIVALRLDDARNEARALDERIRAGDQVGPLAGVPFTVKDVIATADLPTTCGSRVLEGHRTVADATVVARLRAAGAILVGKSNCPEFGFGVDTVNDLHGRTRNPLGDLTPGGSSGGEGSAVAAGLSAFGVGADYGGSVRWPAQCAGIVGLRPTVGRCPRTGVLPAISDDEPIAPNARSFQGRIHVIGFLAASIADLELGLRVAAGPDGVDARTAPVPLADPADIRMTALEVRYGMEVGGLPVVSEASDAVAWAAEVLVRGGSQVARGLPRQLDDAVDLYSTLRNTDPLTEIRRVSRGREDLLTEPVRALLATAPDTDEAELVSLWALRDRLAGELTGWLRGDRLLVLPVASQLPWRSAEAQGTSQVTRFDILSPCRAISLFDLPALSVPCPPAADGRPVSVQLVAPPYREDLVLAAGRWIELQLATSAGG